MVSLKKIIGKESPKKGEKADRIDFDRENMIRCLCPQCGVQKNSECAQNKMKMLQISMRGMSPEPIDFPGMYCANGTAFCSDLDKTQKCRCSECKVYDDYKLNLKQPNKYFCKNGKVK